MENNKVDEIGPFLKMLKDDDIKVQVEAMKFLQKLFKKKPISYLDKILRKFYVLNNIDYSTVQGIALKALASHKTKAVNKIVVRSLEKNIIWVQDVAEQILLNRKDPTLIRSLKKMLNNTSNVAWIKAANVLAKWKVKEAVGPLINIMTRGCPMGLEYAIPILGRFKDKRAIEPLKNILENKKRILGNCSTKASKAELKRLREEIKDIQERVAAAINEINAK